MSHSTTDPSVFCMTRSVFPSPKKSPVPLTCHEPRDHCHKTGVDNGGAAHVPQHDRAIVVLHDDRAATIAEEGTRILRRAMSARGPPQGRR